MTGGKSLRRPEWLSSLITLAITPTEPAAGLPNSTCISDDSSSIDHWAESSDPPLLLALPREVAAVAIWQDALMPSFLFSLFSPSRLLVLMKIAYKQLKALLPLLLPGCLLLPVLLLSRRVFSGGRACLLHEIEKSDLYIFGVNRTIQTNYKIDLGFTVCLRCISFPYRKKDITKTGSNMQICDLFSFQAFVDFFKKIDLWKLGFPPSSLSSSCLWRRVTASLDQAW